MKRLIHSRILLCLFITGCLCFPASIHAQIINFASSVFSNKFSVNPSQAGISNHWKADFNFASPVDNSQPGLPKDYGLSVDGAISESAGVGLSYMGQQSGVLRQNLYYFSYAYGFKLSHSLNLRAGISAGFKSLQLNPDLFMSGTFVGDLGDPTVIAFNSIPPSFYSCFGITLYTKSLEFQAVIPNLTSGLQSNELKAMEYTLAQGSIGYKVNLAREGAYMKFYAGGTLYKQTGSIYTAGLQLAPYNFLSFNILYNTSGSVTGGAGITLTKSVQVDFNYSVGGLYSNAIYGGAGVSEIHLGYLFDKKSKNK